MLLIKDKYHQITIQLTTKLANKHSLYLSVYKLNSVGDDVKVHDYVPTIDGDVCTFVIKYRDSWFNIGDTISKLVVGILGTYNLYDLHEGISVIVDGVESNVGLVENGQVVIRNTTEYIDGNPVTVTEQVMVEKVTNPQFALKFDDTEAHTVQAVYKGNREIGVGVSEPVIFQAQQRPVDDTDTSTTAKYVLKITKMPSTIKYMTQPDWQFRLTKGGVGVAGKTVEIGFPYANENSNGIDSHTTNSEGYINITHMNSGSLKRWTVGKHKITGRFYHYDEVEDNKNVLTRVEKQITIVKNSPTITFRKAGAKGKNARFGLFDPLGGAMAKTKLTIKVGSKKYIKTTNSKGYVYMAVNNTGHFKYSVSYAGDSNYNKVTKKFEETI